DSEEIAGLEYGLARERIGTAEQYFGMGDLQHRLLPMNLLSFSDGDPFRDEPSGRVWISQCGSRDGSIGMTDRSHRVDGFAQQFGTRHGVAEHRRHSGASCQDCSTPPTELRHRHLDQLVEALFE